MLTPGSTQPVPCRPRWGNENRLSPGSPGGDGSGGGPAVDPGLLLGSQGGLERTTDSFDGAAPPPPEPAWHQTVSRWFGELQYKVGLRARSVWCASAPFAVCRLPHSAAPPYAAPPACFAACHNPARLFPPFAEPQYFNWRQDTWSDLQLFMLLNAIVFMAGAWVEVSVPCLTACLMHIDGISLHRSLHACTLGFPTPVHTLKRRLSSNCAGTPAHGWLNRTLLASERLSEGLS